ncbi:hypothetical protein MTR_8g026813 [Medicago truncatula]|uniref:Uncharacterized protein n=1 Tax=Medicago truncatula TaxID=3880 RepID=A0A072TMF3_MEDTR|nr:hypothetical protein MTR_8g026813 [Medicago truncatula]
MFKAVKSIEIWCKYRPLPLSYSDVYHSTEKMKERERERESFILQKKGRRWRGSTYYGQHLPLWIKHGNRLTLMEPNKQFQFYILLFLNHSVGDVSQIYEQ